jgi:hypothetical protein
MTTVHSFPNSENLYSKARDVWTLETSAEELLQRFTDGYMEFIIKKIVISKLITKRGRNK